jgi:predicted tellurium resistance membrane protein TerC
VVYGLLAIVASVLAGPNRVGTSVRRWLAPGFRHSVVVVYAVVVAILLILVAWAPFGSGRSEIGTLVLFVLILFGIELLRRQTLREFPEQRAPATRSP